MPATIEQYIKLRECIFMYSEAAKIDDTKFKRLWTMAFRGFTQMGFNSFWQPVTTELPINDNRTVTLPDDYLQWIKVGQMSGNEITLLKNNQSLLSATSSYKGVADVVNNDWWFNGFGRYGRTCYHRPIEFKIENGAILLDTHFIGDNLLLEYIASPEQDDDFTIPVQFTEAMIAWLALKDIDLLPTTSHFGNNNIRMRQEQYRAALKLAKKMYNPFRASEIIGGFAEFNQ